MALTSAFDPARRRSPRTLALYRDRIETKVLPTLGTIAIDKVTVADLRRLVEKLGATLAPATVTQVISMTSALMRYAVRQRYITHNPVRDLDRDDRPGVARQSEPRYLSADEIALLLSKMGDTFRPVAATCAYAGLRISETLGLTWADFDFDAKRINVARQLDPDGSLRNSTKTKSSTAFVPLLPALERELRAYRSRQSEIDLRLVRRTSLVFTTTQGKPQTANFQLPISGVFSPVAREAAVAAPRNAGTSETELCLEARERMSVMDRERPSHFGCIQTYCTRGYPIDSGLRRAYRVERGRRRGSPIAPALTDRLLGNGRGALTSVRPRSRELAERASNGTQVRLLWRQGTRQLWVEVWEPDRDRALAVPVQPERALDAFHHPYAYASLYGIPVAPESLTICGRRPQAAHTECREQ